MNGQQRLVWLHPNGYLMTQQENGWVMGQLPSHSQPVKVVRMLSHNNYTPYLQGGMNGVT